MSSVPMSAKAFLARDADVRAEAPLRAFVAALVERDYYLIENDRELDRVGAIFAAMRDDAPNPLTPGTSPLLDERITAFIAGVPNQLNPYQTYTRSQLMALSDAELARAGHVPPDGPQLTRAVLLERAALLTEGDAEDAENLNIGAFSARMNAELGPIFFGFTCAPKEGLVRLHGSNGQFDGSFTHPIWLDLVQALYTIWRPLYLFPAYDGSDPHNTREQVLAGIVTYLSVEYNYFGPELAQKLGRERLLQTPGVRVTELADGGVLLGQGDTEQAADYLGWTVSA